MENKKLMGAKNLSKLSILVADILVVGLSILNGFDIIHLSVDDNIKIGTFIVASWAGVFGSIYIDKLTTKKTDSEAEKW